MSIATSLANNSTCSPPFFVDSVVHHYTTRTVHDPHLSGSYNLTYWLTHDGLAITDGDVV